MHKHKARYVYQKQKLRDVNKCEIALVKAAKPENHDQIIAVHNKIKTLVDHINRVKNELYRNKDLANMSENFNKVVNDIQIDFKDLDLFITHTYSHVLPLQHLQADGELRLKRAIDSMRGDNASDTVKAQLEYMLESERRKLAPENQKKIQNIRADSEKQLRQQLKKQAEAHTDHLQDVVNMKESELKRQYTRQLEDKMATEKANYKLQLAAMLSKIRGMVNTAIQDINEELEDPISKAELQNTKFDYSSKTSVDWDIAKIEQCDPFTAIHLQSLPLAPVNKTE
uniref:MICOS complex subunit MIC60 n=1 Tax=Glossina pallidipes TaxID=7398 RepID=A0A1A9ZP92_GLOPL